jgi:hypothetical protein
VDSECTVRSNESELRVVSGVLSIYRIEISANGWYIPMLCLCQISASFGAMENLRPLWSNWIGAGLVLCRC